MCPVAIGAQVSRPRTLSVPLRIVGNLGKNSEDTVRTNLPSSCRCSYSARSHISDFGSGTSLPGGFHSPFSAMASATSNHAAAAAPVFGSSSLKIPPRWDPNAAGSYSFKKWVQDVLLWSMVTDLPLTQQAPAVVLQQTGTVREILRSIDPGVLAQGGVLDMMDGFGPRAQTGLTIVLYLLSQKFLPLGYEQNVMASQMLMNFQRHSGESIDAALCRYDTVRYKAAQEANLDLGPAGTTYHMLNALQVPQQMWTLLLQPFQGNMPATEQELIQLQEHLRRQGHLMEGVLNKGQAEARPMVRATSTSGPLVARPRLPTIRRQLHSVPRSWALPHHTAWRFTTSSRAQSANTAACTSMTRTTAIATAPQRMKTTRCSTRT